MQGIGTGGGFKMMIAGPRAAWLMQARGRRAYGMMGAANQEAERGGRLHHLQRVARRGLGADIDRERAEQMGVPVEAHLLHAERLSRLRPTSTTSTYLGRTYRVTAQADAPYRRTIRRTSQNCAPASAAASMVPLGVRHDADERRRGRIRVVRYNLYPGGRACRGIPARLFHRPFARRDGGAGGAARCRRASPMTGRSIAYQQKQAGNTGMLAFGLAVVFVFLLLAALYESLVLPLAVILIVPMCLLGGDPRRQRHEGMDNNILTQIGLVVLIGLAAKNAILIVEFARQGEKEELEIARGGRARRPSRLRPILMTSHRLHPRRAAAGDEQRRRRGDAAGAGRRGVLRHDRRDRSSACVFTPAFYVISRKLGDRASRLFHREGRAPAPESARNEAGGHHPRKRAGAVGLRCRAPIMCARRPGPARAGPSSIRPRARRAWRAPAAWRRTVNGGSCSTIRARPAGGRRARP